MLVSTIDNDTQLLSTQIICHSRHGHLWSHTKNNQTMYEGTENETENGQVYEEEGVNIIGWWIKYKPHSLPQMYFSFLSF